jgi:predicted transcriptional regulator
VWVRFHDGPPSGSNQLGTFQLIPLITGLGGAGNATVSWTAWPTGAHDICVAVDPGNSIAETNETNNVACAQVLVTSTPEPWADYVPDAPQPLPPLRAGLLRPVSFSLRVRNQGDAPANVTSTLAFFNGTTLGSPFATFSLPLLLSTEVSSRFVATWLSPATPGTYAVSAKVDSGDSLVEWDETNNVFAWQVDVVTGPVTSLILGTPNVTAAQPFATSATEVSFSVLDQGASGIRSTWYGVDTRTWRNYSADGPFRLSGEGPHLVEWYSEDFMGNVEDIQSEVVIVDDSAPTIYLSIGDPQYVGAQLYVRSTTPIAISASDGGVVPVGLSSIEYRIGNGMWVPYGNPFTVSPPDGATRVEYAATDHLGHRTPDVRDVILDDTPPSTRISPATDSHTPDTVFALAATDGGSGVALTEIWVNGEGWTPYTGGFALPAGDHVVRYRSVDRLNNAETEHAALITIVATAPPPFGGGLLWLLLLLGTISVGALGLNESLRVSFLTPFVILWARLSRSDILDNKKRGMVVGYLAANPAANFAAIRADLNMAMGTLTYHLWVLEKEGEIKSWRDGRFRRYAPHGHRVAEMQPRLTDIELLLLKRIRETAGLTQKELAKDVGVSQPAVSYHISRMAALGVLHVERRGRKKRYSADLGDVPGDVLSQVDRTGVTGSEPVDETDPWGASR